MEMFRVDSLGANKANGHKMKFVL